MAPLLLNTERLWTHRLRFFRYPAAGQTACPAHPRSCRGPPALRGCRPTFLHHLCQPASELRLQHNRAHSHPQPRQSQPKKPAHYHGALSHWSPWPSSAFRLGTTSTSRTPRKPVRHCASACSATCPREALTIPSQRRPRRTWSSPNFPGSCARSQARPGTSPLSLPPTLGIYRTSKKPWPHKRLHPPRSSSVFSTPRSAPTPASPN